MSAPLTPPDSDLQDFPFMPLHVARLRDSDLASEESPEACWYAVLLWAASWHQLPAGSLPDNEIVLTKLLGLGRDLKTFRKHRAGALRGWVKCDDGRLYHPVVAEQVCTSWRGKLEQRWRTECARIKKRNQRDNTSIPSPTFEEFVATLPPGHRVAMSPDDEAESPQGRGVLSLGTTPQCPQGNGLQGTGIETETGIIDSDADASSGQRTPSPAFEAFWQAYPRKTAKAKALKAFPAALAKCPVEAMIAALERQREWEQWRRGVIPHPATWLNGARWADEDPPATQVRLIHERPDPRTAKRLVTEANYAAADVGAYRAAGRDWKP